MGKQSKRTNPMDTTLTSGNLQSFLRLLDEKGVTPKRFTVALSDGRLADALDEKATYKHRDEVRKLYGLEPLVAPELPPLLVFDDTHIASVDLSEPHDPDAFWHTTKQSPARYVYDTFRTNVIARARPIMESSGDVQIPYADLSRNTNVRAILDTQGVGDHDPSKLSKIIAAMIKKQPNGEALKNGLLNDGSANLFACGSVLVSVRWDGVGREWNAFVWSPDVDVDAGLRVFSGNLKL